MSMNGDRFVLPSARMAEERNENIAKLLAGLAVAADQGQIEKVITVSAWKGNRIQTSTVGTTSLSDQLGLLMLGMLDIFLQARIKSVAVPPAGNGEARQ